MKHVLAILLLAFSSSVFASGPCFSSRCDSGADAEASANASAAAVAAQSQSTKVGVQTSVSVAPASTTATGGNGGAGGSSNTTIVDVDPSKIKVFSAPNVSAPTALPTAPCRISHSAGITVVGLGVSGGSSSADDQCNEREEKRVNVSLILAIGDADAARAYICQDPKVQAAYAAVNQRCSK